MKYNPDEDWDFHLENAHSSVDLSLALPHYRARNQPVEHRMNMFIGSEVAPIKVKVVRYTQPSPPMLSDPRNFTVSPLSSLKVLSGNPSGYIRRNSLVAL